MTAKSGYGPFIGVYSLRVSPPLALLARCWGARARGQGARGQPGWKGQGQGDSRAAGLHHREQQSRKLWLGLLHPAHSGEGEKISVLYYILQVKKKEARESRSWPDRGWLVQEVA